jgi:hypothetical protein
MSVSCFTGESARAITTLVYVGLPLETPTAKASMSDLDFASTYDSGPKYAISMRPKRIASIIDE